MKILFNNSPANIVICVLFLLKIRGDIKSLELDNKKAERLGSAFNYLFKLLIQQ